MSNVKIYGQKPGKTLLKVTKEGDNLYEPISEYIALTINKIKQENVLLKNINNKNEIYLDDKNTSYTLSVENTNDTEILYRVIQSFSYAENNQVVCVIEKNKLIPMNEGICIIEAILYESDNYLETRTNQIVVSIYKKDQEDLKTIDLVEIEYNKSIKLTLLSGDDNTSDFIFSSNNPSICSVVNDMLIARKSGRCIITSIKKGNDVFNDIKKEYNIKVKKIKQPNILLKNVSIDNELFVNPEFPNSLGVTNIQENGKVFYIISDPNICLVKDGKLYGLSEGKCQLQAIIGETDNYLTTKTNTLTLNVVKNDQSELTITKSGELNYLSSITLSTTGGSTGEEVIYSTKSDTIKIVNNYVFGLKYGLARVVASFEGNKMYNPIKKEIDFIVNKIPQPNLKIKNINESNTIFVNPNIPHKLKTYEIMEDAYLKFIIISSNIPDVCSISSKSIIGTNEGTCLVQAITSETNNYLETKSEPILVKVIKNDQDPLIIEYDKTINYKETKYIKVYGGNSGKSPTVSVIDNDDNCILNGYEVYGNKTGVCPILVKKDTDFMYNSIEKTIFIEVLPIPQQNIFITDLNELNEIEVDPNVQYKLSVSNTDENPIINYYIVSQIPVQNNKEVGSIKDNIIVPLNEGTIDLKAVLNMTNNYIETTTPIYTINVILKSAANYIVDKIPQLFYNSSILITINGGLFNNEYELISKEQNLVVVGNEVYGKKVGVYNLIVSKKATFMYKALNKKLKIIVYKIKQPNFNFIDLDTTIYVEPNIGIELKTTSPLESAKVRYVIVSETPTNSSRVAGITENKLFPYNEGITIIKAITTETDNYLSTETNLITINVIRKEQKPIKITNIGELFYGSTTLFTLSGGSIESTLLFTKNNNNCNVLLNKNTIEGLNAGMCKIIITKKGNYMYNDTSLTLNINVKKISQTIKLEDVNSENIIINEPNVTTPINITGVKENPNIKYIVSNPDVCVINNNNIITISEGRTTIKAILFETQNYLQTETNTITIDIIKLKNTSFTIIPSDILYINKTIQLKIISINKRSPIKLVSDNDKISIDGQNITGHKYGVSKLTITQLGDEQYEDIVTNYVIQIRKIKQNIILKQINSNNLINVDDNTSYDLVIENVKENANITYYIKQIENQIVTQIPCYIKNGKVFPFCEGSCLIYATVDETENYDTTSSNQITVTVYKNKDLKDLGSFYNIDYNSLFDLNKLDPLLIYESSNNENCTIVNNVLFAKKAGKYNITYFKSADRLFFDLQKTFVVNVKKIYQTCILTNITETNTIYVNPNNKIELQITGIKEKAPIFYNILGNEDNLCVINKNILVPLKSGKITIEAYLSETDNYLTTKLNSINVNIIKNEQLPISINFSGTLEYLGSISVNILGGSTDINVILDSSDKTICSILNNTILGLQAKTCSIIAIKPGNFMYNDIKTSQIITVKKIYQPNFIVLPFNDENTIYVNPETTHILKTNEVKENGKVIYKSDNNDLCSINNDQLIPLLSGICNIHAISAETDNYLETKSELVKLNIIKNNQSELIIKYPPKINYKDFVYLEVSGGNTINKIIPNIDSSFCAINENYQLEGTYVGLGNINFYKEGNFMYNDINKIISIDTIKIFQKNINIKKINETNEIEVDPELEIELNLENIDDNPKIEYEIISQTPVKKNVLNTIKIIDNKLYSLNEGSAVIRAKCLETHNYLETFTPEFEIKVNLKSAKNFNIDTIPTLFYNSSVRLTIDGSFDKAVFEIKSNDNNGLSVNENELKGNYAGSYKLTVTKLATFQFKALSKTVNINVYKIKQPSFSITNSNLTLLIDIYKSYKIETSIPEEEAIIKYELISNTSTNSENVCILNGNQMFCINEGKVILKAKCLETKNYLDTESSIVTFNISKNDQIPLSIEPLDNLYINGYINLNVIGGSTSTSNIYYINNSNCYIQDGKIYGVNSGMSVIKILRKGNYMYNDVTYKFKIFIYKIPQTVKLNDINENNEVIAFSSETYDLICDGIKEFGNIEYKILDSSSNFVNNELQIDVCKISGKNKIIGLNAGTCRIQGRIHETQNYLETLTNILTIKVNKNTISDITVSQSDILYLNSQVEIKIEGTDMNQVKIVPNNENLTVSGNIVFGLKPGNTALNLIKDDTENKKGFNINYNIKVNKNDQNVKLDDINEKNILYVNPNLGIDINVLYIQDNAQYTVKILECISGESDVKNENVCAIKDNKLYVFSSGFCILQAEVYETNNFNSVMSNRITVTMKKNEQKSIDLDIVNSLSYLESLNLDSITGKSGDVLLYEITNENCEIINNTLIARKVGKSILKAYFMPTTEYEGAIRYYNIEVKKINQPDLLLENISDTNLFLVDPVMIYNLELKNIKENAKYVITSTDLNICKIINNTIKFIAEGECDLYFTTLETTSYLSTKSNIIKIKINKNEQTNFNINNNTDLFYGSSIKMLYSGGNTDSNVIYTTKSTNCEIINDNVLGLAYGVCTIIGYKEGDFMYKPISKSINIIVNKIYQPSFILNEIETLFVDPQIAIPLNLLKTQENAIINFELIDNDNIISINNNSIFTQNSGTCKLKIISSETNNYLETESNIITINVIKKQQKEIKIVYPTEIEYLSETQLEIFGGSTNNPFLFTYTNNNCLIDENFKLKGLLYGDCRITILKEGNFMYENIQKVIDIHIKKILQPNVNIELFNELNEIEVDPNSKYYLNIQNTNENPIIKYEIISMTPDLSNNPILITVTGNLLVPINAGETLIKAILAETNNYLETETPSIIVSTILKTPDNYIIDKLSPLFYHSTIPFTVNKGEFTDEYYLESLGDCISVSGNILYGLKAGQSFVSITKKATFMYKSKTKKIKITVNKIEQPLIEMIDLSANIFVNPNIYVPLKTNEMIEKAKVTFKIINNNGIDGQLIVFNNDNFYAISSGQFKFYAQTIETNNYLETKSKIFVVNINKNEQEELIVKIQENITIETSSPINVTGGSTEGNVIFKTNNTSCTIQNNTVYGVSSNVCKITATKFGNAMYNDVSKTIKIYVGKVNQKVKLVDINSDNKINVNPFNGPELLIDGIKENAQIAYNVVDIKGSKVCFINSKRKLIALNEGICTIEALLYETENYLPTKTNKITVEILPLPQDELLVEQDNTLYYNSSIKLLVYGGSNNNEVVVTSSNNNCDISGTIIFGVRAGKSLLTITKKAGENYKEISTTYGIVINKIDQSIILEQVNNKNELIVNDEVYLRIRNIQENATVSYEITQDSQICYIDNNDKLTALNSGTCTIQAKTTETTNYLPTKTNSITVLVNKKEQEKLNVLNETKVDYNDSIKLSTIGGNSDLNIVYTSSNKNCEIITDTLIAKHSGKCIIYAYKKGDTSHDDVTTEFSVTINKINQTNLLIKDLPNNNKLFVNSEKEYMLELLNIKENAPYKFYISDSNICNIKNNKLTVDNEGECEIYFESYETDNYLETKSNIIKIKAIKNNQIPLIYSFSPNQLFYKSSIQAYTDGGSTSNQVILSTHDNNNCQISNHVLIGLNYGYAIINVFKEGNYMYNDINDTFKVNIEKILQPNFTLLNINNTNTIYVNPNNPITLRTSAVDENATVIYQIKYPFSNDLSKIASINGDQLYANFSGQCTITALSLQTNNYLETTSNTITVTIIKNDQDELTIKYPEQIKYNDTTYIESFGGNTENKILFTIDNENCIIDENNKLKGLIVGKSIVTATKEGNFMYNTITKDFEIEVIKIKQNNILIEDINELNEIEVNPDSKYYINTLNISESAKISYEIINMVPDNSNNSQVCSLNDNLLIPLNSGYVEIKGKTSETISYIQTETPIFRINILLSSPSNFIVDKVPILYLNSSIKITIDNNKFNVNDYEFSTVSENISVNNNAITGLMCGTGYLLIKKKETFMFKALTKKVKITVNKLQQPKFEIINLNSEIYINPSEPLLLTTTETMENALVTYKILSYNVSGSPGKIGYILNNKLTTLNIGTFLLQAISKETNSYLSTESPILNITIIKNEQTKLEVNVTDNVLKGEYIPYTVTGGSTMNNLKVVVNNDNCSVNESNIYGIYAGQSKITIIKPGNFMYNDIISKIIVNVLKIPQEIKLLDINNNNTLFVNSNKSYELVVSNISENGNIKFENKSNNDVCVIRDNKLTAVKAGKCIIQATIAETTNYKESTSNELEINVNTIPQDDIDITFNTLYYKSNTHIIVNGDISNNIVITSESKNCSISGNIVYGKNYGKCLLKVTKLGDDIYNSITKTVEINVNKIKQDIKLNKINDDDTIYIDQNKQYTILLDGVEENPYIKYISSDTSIVNIVNNQLFALIEGKVMIHAFVGETDNYLETESNKISLNIVKQQTELKGEYIKLNLDFNSKIELQPFSISNSNYREIIYETENNNCKLINNVVIGMVSGFCNITAKLKGDEQFVEQVVKYNIKVNKIKQPQIKISLYDYENYYYINPNIGHQINITQIIENPKINYIVSNNSLCRIDDNKIYGLNEGEVTIYLQTSETDNYLSSTSNKINLRFIKNNQADITVLDNIKLYYNQLTKITVNGGSIMNLPIITTDSSNCKILSDQVLGLSYGHCVLNIMKEGNFMYNPVKTSIKLLINKVEQPNFIIYNINKTNTILVNSTVPIKLNVSETMENPIILFKVINNSSNNEKIVSTDGFNLYADMEGTCTLIAIAKETKNYLETQSKPMIINVEKNKQDPIDIKFPPIINYQEKIYIESSGGNTDLPIKFKTSNDNCIIDSSNNLVLGNKTGSCVITASKEGNNMYQPIKKKIVVKIIKIEQPNLSINKFNELNEIRIDMNKTHILSIKNINEDPKINYIIVNDKPVDKTVSNTIKLVDNQITAINEGLCQIKAIISETPNYKQTETSIIDIHIKLNDPNDFIVDTLKSINYDTSFNITVNDGYYNIDEYDIVPENLDAFNINKNVLIPLISGEQKINVIKRSTSTFKELSKMIKIQINKIDQPNFNITKLSQEIFINLQNPYVIDTTPFKELSKVTFEIISSSPNGNSGPVCKIDKNNLFALNLGTCLIQAVSSETNNYNKTISPVFNLSCIKNNQSPLEISDIQNLYYDSYITLSVFGGSTNSSIQIRPMSNNFQIKDNILYGILAGSGSITLFKPGNNVYNDIKMKFKLTVYKPLQDIKLLNINDNNEIVQGSTYNLVVEELKENPHLKYNIVNVHSTNENKNICYFSGNTLITLLPGVVILEVETDETLNYLSTKSNQIVVTITPRKQNDIIILPSDPLLYKSFITLNVSGGSIDSNFIVKANNSNCIVENNKIYGNKTGKCKLTIEKLGNNIYDKVIKDYIINVQKINQTPIIEILNIKNNTIYADNNNSYNIKVSNIFENPNIKYNLVTNFNNCCELINNKIFGVNSGYFVLNATIYETANYLETITQNIQINVIKKNQNEIITDIVKEINYNDSFKLNTDGGNTENKFDYNIDGSSCIVENDMLIGKKGGTCKLTITKKGNNLYNDISKEIMIKVNKIYQSELKINNINEKNTIFVNPSIKYKLSISNVNEKPNILFKVSNYNILNVIDDYLYGLSEGIAEIYFITNETENYLETKSNVLTIVVNKNEQATFNINLSNKLYFNGSTTINIFGGSVIEDPIYAINNNNVKIINNTIIGLNSGTTQIIATKPGNYMYEPIKTNIFIEVLKIEQPNFTLLNINNTNNIFVDYDNPIKLLITNVFEDPLVTYTIEYENQKNNIYINNGYLYSKSEGICYITAVTAETDNYLITKSNRLKVTVVKREQKSLVFKYPTNLKYLEKGYVTIKGGNTKNPVILKSTSPNLIIENNTIIGNKVGTYTIEVTKEGNDLYLPIKSSININIIPVNQPNIKLIDINQTNEIMINPEKEISLLVENILENADYKLIIVKNKPIDITQKDVCIIQNNKLVGLNIGTCIIKAITNKTNNYLETETNEINITVILNDSEQFFIDKLPIIELNKSGKITIENGFDTNKYKIIAQTDNIDIENNIIYGKKAGNYYLNVTKISTTDTKELSKKILITVNKIKQPNFIFNIDDKYFVNTTEKLKIKPNNLLEDSRITYQILSNNPIGEYSDDVCIINNGIYAVNQGKCTIKAISSETNNYLATEFVFDINIVRNIQNDIQIDNTDVIIDSFIDLKVSGGSTTNNILFFNEDNNTYVVNNRLYGISGGVSKLSAYIKGNQIYEPITKTFDIIVNKKYQSVILQQLNINNEIVIKPDVGYKIFVTNVKDNAYINYEFTNGYVKEGLFYPYKPGKCTLKAILTETNKFLETATNTINIIAKTIIIDVLDIQLLGPLYFNSKTSYNVISNNSNEPVNFTLKSDKCSIKDNFIYGLKSGKCLITAYKNGLNSNIIYKDFVVNVQKIKQNVILQNININNTIYINEEVGIELKIIGINENPNIDFIVKKISGLTQMPCNIKNNKLYGLSSGSCHISAVLGETNNYLSTKTNGFIVTVLKNDANDIKLNSTNIVKVNDSINLDFSDNSEISLISNNDKCIVTNNNLIGVKAGMCVVTLNKNATSITNKLIKNFIINVIKNEQKNVILENINSSNTINVDDIYDLNVLNVIDNAKVIFRIISEFNSKNSTVCIIDNNKLIAINEGICYINATISETDNYNEYNTNKIMITVIKKEQAPLKLADTINVKFNDSVKIDKTNDISYVSNNNNIKIINNVLIGINSGTSIITASKQGNNKFNDISTKINVIINKIYQPNLSIIGLTDYTIKIDKENGYKLFINNTSEKPSVSFEIFNSSSKDVCKIDASNTLFGLKEGSCYIRGITTETKNYLETKTAPIKITVIKNNQNEIKFSTLDQLNFNSSIKLSIEGSDINTPVKYSVVDSSNCSIVNNVLYGINSGSCIIKAVKDGNELYNSIETNLQIDIFKIPQPNFSLNKLENVIVSLDPYILKTTTPIENANVYYKVLTSVNSKNQIENIVYINDNKLYALKAGVCIIQAVTSETENYLSTKSNQIIISVIPEKIIIESTKPTINIPVEMPIEVLSDMINVGLPVTAITTIQKLTSNNIKISSPEAIKELLNAGVPQKSIANIIQIANNAIPIPVNSLPVPKELPNYVLQQMILNGLPPTAINTIQQLTSIGIPLNSPIALKQLNNIGVNETTINNIQTIVSSVTPIPINSMEPILQLPLKTVQELINNGISPTLIPTIQQMVSIGIPLNSTLAIEQLTKLGVPKNIINTTQQITSNVKPVVVTESTPTFILSNDTIQKMVSNGLSPNAINTVQQLVSAGIPLQSEIAIKELTKIGVSQNTLVAIQSISSTEPPVPAPIQYVVKKPEPVLIANIISSSESAIKQSMSSSQKSAILKLLQQLQNKKSVPVQSKPVPVQSQPIPIQSKPVPVQSKPVPVQSKPVPVQSKPVPVQSKLVPIQSKPVSVQSKPIPKIVSSAKASATTGTKTKPVLRSVTPTKSTSVPTTKKELVKKLAAVLSKKK